MPGAELRKRSAVAPWEAPLRGSDCRGLPPENQVDAEAADCTLDRLRVYRFESVFISCRINLAVDEERLDRARTARRSDDGVRRVRRVVVVIVVVVVVVVFEKSKFDQMQETAGSSIFEKKN